MGSVSSHKAAQLSYTWQAFLPRCFSCVLCLPKDTGASSSQLLMALTYESGPSCQVALVHRASILLLCSYTPVTGMPWAIVFDHQTGTVSSFRTETILTRC